MTQHGGDLRVAPNLSVHFRKGTPTMTAFQIDVTTEHTFVEIDNRFRVKMRRNAPPPMASAQLVLEVYPILDGEMWDEPYDVFAVDEARIIELENEAREARQ
jgi:hypothetical protein